MQALAAIDAWPAPFAAAGVVRGDDIVATRGDLGTVVRWASITKLLTAGAVLVAAEEGSLELDDPAGPPGSTIRHLLAHASGLPFEGAEPIAPPGRRRIYSNTGYELLGRVIEERSGMPYEEYLRAAVLGPCGLDAVRIEGTPAAGAVGTLRDLLAFGRAILAPRFVAPETLDEATHVAFPGLDGVLPGFGRQTPCDWGLGFELKDGKPGHWAGTRDLVGDLRSFRRVWHVPLGRSGDRRCARVPHGSRVRRVGIDRLAGALGRGRRGAASLLGRDQRANELVERRLITARDGRRAASP